MELLVKEGDPKKIDRTNKVVYRMGYVMNAVIPFLFNWINGLEYKNGLRDYEKTYTNGEALDLYQGSSL